MITDDCATPLPGHHASGRCIVQLGAGFGSGSAVGWHRLAVCWLVCACLVLAGCGRDQGLTDDQARSLVESTLGNPLPPDARILHVRHTESGYTLLILHSPSELLVGSHAEPVHRSRIPAGVVAQMVREFTRENLPAEAIGSSEADYSEWKTAEHGARLRQMDTAEGWYATLEVSPE